MLGLLGVFILLSFEFKSCFEPMVVIVPCLYTILSDFNLVSSLEGD